MTTRLNPYLSFRDNAREALEFYQSVFGGELTLSTFAELQAAHDESDNEKLMHGQLVSPTDLVLMASDTPTGMDFTPNSNGSISLSGEDEAELRGYWDKLSDGATITAPITTAPWGDTFGMCIDKFGVNWLVNIAAPKQ